MQRDATQSLQLHFNRHWSMREYMWEGQPRRIHRMMSLTSVSVELLLLLCIVWSCQFVVSLRENSLHEQTKYNPYPGIHSLTTNTYHAASERYYTVCLFSAAPQQSATQEILQRTAHVGGASLLTKDVISCHCELINFAWKSLLCFTIDDLSLENTSLIHRPCGSTEKWLGI